MVIYLESISVARKVIRRSKTSSSKSFLGTSSLFVVCSMSIRIVWIGKSVHQVNVFFNFVHCSPNLLTAIGAVVKSRNIGIILSWMNKWVNWLFIWSYWLNPRSVWKLSSIALWCTVAWVCLVISSRAKQRTCFACFDCKDILRV